MWAAIVILAVGFIAASGAAGWLYVERRRLIVEVAESEAETVEAETQLAAANQQNASLGAELASLRTDIAVAAERHRAIETAFEKAQQQLRDVFRSLAGDVLKETNQQFLQLARKVFEGEQKDATAQLEQRQQAIKAMVDPIRETLEKYRTSLTDIEKSRTEAYGQLREQLRALLEDQGKLRGETANLVKALRRPEVRGRWGELQMQRVAELAGMIQYCDFDTQASTNTEDGRLRPDMVVRLPSKRSIVVDAKAPIDAFLDSLECEDDESRGKCLDRHVQQIMTQVQKLAAKEYSRQFEQAPEFVVLFIPGESFLQAAVQRRPDMIESAMDKGVIIATPSTLICLLKVVAMGWREQQLAENAQKISELGRTLHERLALLVDNIDKVGKSLESAVKNYNGLVGSFEGRVMVSARRFAELGADSGKVLPVEIKQVELQPRELKAAE